MTIRGDHGDRFRLQHHQGAIQRITRFFVGDRKAGLRDHGTQYLCGNLYDARGWEYRKAREVRLRHANHLGVRAAAADADPVVLKQLDGDFGVGQQLHVVVKLAGRNGTGAFLFDLGGTCGAETEIEVGGRERKLVSSSLEQVVGEDRDCSFAFYDTLRRRELTQKFKLADRDLHRSSSSRGGLFNRHNRISPSGFATSITFLYQNKNL